MEDYNNQQTYNNRNYSNYGYDQNQDYGYDPNGYGDEGPNKKVKGLKIMIIIMAVILAALSAMRDDFAIERDTLTQQLSALRNDYDTLKSWNDTLSVQYDSAQFKVDSLIETLQKERRLSYAKIRQYEKEKNMMRQIMEGYIRQIDSLNTINKKLVGENSSIRKKLLDYRLRA